MLRFLLPAVFALSVSAFSAAPPKPRNGSLILVTNDDGFSSFHSGRYKGAEDLRKSMLEYKDTQIAVMEDVYKRQVQRRRLQGHLFRRPVRHDPRPHAAEPADQG